MGHERIGFLPKSLKWNKIVSMLSDYDGNIDIITSISYNTLDNVKKLYEKMPYNESVIKAFKYLVLLSVSSNFDNQINFLEQNGFNIDDKMSLFGFAKSVKDFVKIEQGSPDTNKMAQDAVLKAITAFEQQNLNYQISLFGDESQNIWRNIGQGTDFCILAKTFFASFTENNLRYYLEREAANSINNYDKLERFSRQLAEQMENIANHAFETSKIMQSFAAGWFNNHAVNKVPSQQEIIGFLIIAFGKMREELRREADSIDSATF